MIIKVTIAQKGINNIRIVIDNTTNISLAKSFLMKLLI